MKSKYVTGILPTALLQYLKLKCCCYQCYKQYRYVKFKFTMTKWPVQKPAHRTTHKDVEHQDATDI